jgi:hypothetical protein
MTEIENFLHPNICKYLINFYKENSSLSKTFNKRHCLHLLDLNHNDATVQNVVNKYKLIRPNQYLKNIELIFWPVGESHDWHDDTIYYDYTTITYLNDNYKGGETTVEKYKIKPKTGKICLFSSTKKHKVDILEEGYLYVILSWYKDKN